MTPISVDEKEYLKCNQALARLLVVVTDNQPVSTRHLLQLLKSTGYGQTTLRMAEKKGFITRKRQKSGSVGQPAKMITLTAEGRRLATIARSMKR